MSLGKDIRTGLNLKLGTIEAGRDSYEGVRAQYKRKWGKISTSPILPQARFFSEISHYSAVQKHHTVRRENAPCYMKVQVQQLTQ